MELYTKSDRLIYYHIPTYLFILLPIFLISGSFLSDLSVSLISIIFLTYCFKKKNFLFFKNIYFYFFLLFCFYIVTNSFLNNFNLTSVKISIFYFRFGVFVVAILALLHFDEKFLKNFYLSLLVCFSLLIVDGFWQYFTDYNLFGFPKGAENRVSSFFGDELILGSYISRLFPLLFGLGLFYYSEDRLKFSVLIIVFIFSEILIFLSGERTSFFYMNLSALFIIIFSKDLKTLRFIILLCSLILIAIISLLNEDAKKRIIDRTLKQIAPEIQNTKSDLSSLEKQKIYIFSKQHTHHYISAYRMFDQNKLFGVGVKNFRNFCSKDEYIVSELSCSTHPHNTYLQILSETGLAGFSFIIVILITFFAKLIKHLKMRLKSSFFFNDFEICILSGIIITLWPFVPSGNFFNNWLSIIYFLSLPILFWSMSKSKTKN